MLAVLCASTYVHTSVWVPDMIWLASSSLCLQRSASCCGHEGWPFFAFCCTCVHSVQEQVHEYTPHVCRSLQPHSDWHGPALQAGFPLSAAWVMYTQVSSSLLPAADPLTELQNATTPLLCPQPCEQFPQYV